MSDLHSQTVALIAKQQTDRLHVRMWLYFICLLVFLTVIVGGATRLTDSGLSITEWAPILGMIPPLSLEDWQIAFEKYKLIPEYSAINQDMTLAGFKYIFWWEWAHRFLGRIIGICVIVPLIAFWMLGKLEEETIPRLVLLLLAGAVQGMVGWWMVSSGLVDRVDVSQYRLAIHLTLACVIFAWAFWIARGLAPHSSEDHSPNLNIWAALIVSAITFQIFLGALVAGLDAGLAFNDWPTMDGAVVPQNLLVLSPGWLNFFENPKMVQFVHRLGAYTLLVLIAAQTIITLKSQSGAVHKRRAVLLLILAIIQASIGIITLVLQVPFYWALVHQGMAVILLGFAVAHWRGLKGAYTPQTAIARGSLPNQ